MHEAAGGTPDGTACSWQMTPRNLVGVRVLEGLGVEIPMIWTCGRAALMPEIVALRRSKLAGVSDEELNLAAARRMSCDFVSLRMSISSAVDRWGSGSG